MSEQSMRQHVIKMLRPLDAVSVENPAYPGTPDVNFVEGWVELKWAKRWPERDDTPLKLEHFTQQQRVWLVRRGAAGGNVWLLLCAGGDWLLFHWSVAAQHVGKANREELLHLASYVWERGINAEGLISALTRKGN